VGSGEKRAETSAAVGAAYDATADLYTAFAGTAISPATEGPVDRVLLEAFAEMVADASAGRVADVGCGPGRAAGFLAARGVDVVGVDVSSALLALAQQAHPGVPFVEGQLADLPLADRSLAAAVCWYSIIHTPPSRLGEVCAELDRVLVPGGHLLVAFQAGGGEPVHRAEVGGRKVALTSYRHPVEAVERCLTATGFEVRTRVVRQAELPHESTPQAFLLARAGATPSRNQKARPDRSGHTHPDDDAPQPHRRSRDDPAGHAG
jgi:SAM-dependent methyltransferase